MNKETVKLAFESAEKELNDKQIEKLKSVVKRTLEEIAKVDKELEILQERKKYLKLDIEDLKEGRLDRIEERQIKDEKAKAISIVIIRKETVREVFTPYHAPYVIEVNKPYWSSPTPIFYGMELSSSSIGNQNTGFSISGSLAKNNVIGAYNVEGKVINLR